MNEKCITFLSDFGNRSPYPAQMKAIALRLCPAHLVDITHEIQPHNIREGAFILQTTAPFFPPGTVHVAVVDPGVGTSRRGLLITTRTQIFIGPDNGLLLPAAQSIGDLRVYELTNEKYMRIPRSKTFDGRDVFAPVAAHIVTGVPFEEFGRLIDDYVQLDLGSVKQTDTSRTGIVLYVDHFGNIITNIAKKDLLRHPEQGRKIKIKVGKAKRMVPFVPSYGFVKPQQLLATVGSSDHLEIAMNQGNAAQKLKVTPDMPITITFD